MAKERTSIIETNKNQQEKEKSLMPESHGILAKHRIKTLKNAGISKANDKKKTVTVVNPTSELEKGGLEETGW